MLRVTGLGRAHRARTLLYRPMLLAVLCLAAALVGSTWDTTGTEAQAAEPLETKADPEKGELEMKADELEIDLDNRRAELRGHVELSRSDFVVRCPTVVVDYDEDLEVARAKATGGVVAEAKGVRAEAPEATIDFDSRTLSLDGGVKVTQKSAVVRAQRATVHLETGRVVLYKVEGKLPLSSVALPSSARSSSALSSPPTP